MKLNIMPEQVNLLLIEDDLKVAELIKEQLNSTRHTEFNIVVKTTLEDALLYLQDECALEEECNIDVILLDLMLPNSKGIETFQEVQRHIANIPTVIISAFEDIACKCVGMGAQDYLVKPDIPAPLLVRSVKYAIKRTDIEKQMKNVIMTSPLGYHLYEVIDDDFVFVGHNPSANRILGIDNSQYIGKRIQDAFPNLSSELIEKYRKAMYGIPVVSEIYPYEDDKIHHGYYRVNAYRTAPRHLTVTFEDITQIIKTRNKLEETLEKYKNLIEVTSASIFGLDFVNEKFTYVNETMCDLMEYSREELLQMGPPDFLTPRSKKVWYDRVEALKKGEYVHENVEYECITKTGKKVWVLVTATYPDVTQPIVTANCVAIDITQKKIAEEIIKQREIDAFKLLEGKISMWKDEIRRQEEETKEDLELIDKQISSIDNSNGAEI